jgi:hypothetical protein
MFAGFLGTLGPVTCDSLAGGEVGQIGGIRSQGGGRQAALDAEIGEVVLDRPFEGR